LLAKFLRGSRTSAIHIALGAARKKIFSLHLFQALILGLLAAGLGVVLTALSLWVMRTVSTSLDGVARMDGFVMGMLLLTSLIATLIAGVIPAWRVSRLSPAQSLRTN
jgi:putative ABC transport system permease protein